MRQSESVISVTQSVVICYGNPSILVYYVIVLIYLIGNKFNKLVARMECECCHFSTVVTMRTWVLYEGVAVSK